MTPRDELPPQETYTQRHERFKKAQHENFFGPPPNDDIEALEKITQYIQGMDELFASDPQISLRPLDDVGALDSEHLAIEGAEKAYFDFQKLTIDALEAIRNNGLSPASYESLRAARNSEEKIKEADLKLKVIRGEIGRIGLINYIEESLDSIFTRENLLTLYEFFENQDAAVEYFTTIGTLISALRYLCGVGYDTPLLKLRAFLLNLDEGDDDSLK